MKSRYHDWLHPCGDCSWVAETENEFVTQINSNYNVMIKPKLHISAYTSFMCVYVYPPQKRGKRVCSKIIVGRAPGPHALCEL